MFDTGTKSINRFHLSSQTKLFTTSIVVCEYKTDSRKQNWAWRYG